VRIADPHAPALRGTVRDMENPHIVSKPGDGRGFAAEGEVGGTRFRIGVTFDAAAAAPVRHQTIKEALLDRARAVMQEAEGGGFDWKSRGFERRSWSADDPPCWTYDYSVYDVADLIA